MNKLKIFCFLISIEIFSSLLTKQNFDSKKEEFISRLKEVYGYIFRKNNLIISYTANNEGYKYFDEISGEIIEKLERNDNNTLDQSGLSELVPQVKNEGFKTSSQVSYVTRGGNYKNKGYKYDATFRVLKTILNRYRFMQCFV